MTWDIFGHDWAVRHLERHIARGEMRHAYLLTGPQGVGRRTLALRFAMAINCLRPVTPGVGCGVCRACRQTAAMQYADLSVLQAETEGGTLKVDQVRELQHMLSLTPYEARFRIALLLRFEDANPNAQNALLKTLEEAPARVVLLLTTASAESLLPTIVSRCEVLRLRPAPIPALQEALTARWRLESDEARLLAHLSGGRAGYALRLHEHPDLLEQRRAWLEDMERLLREPRRARFIYAERLAKPKDRSQLKGNLRAAFQTWLSCWRDALLAATGSSVPLVNIDRQDEIRILAARLDAGVIRQRVVDLEEAIGGLDDNLNPQLLIEVLLLDWPRIK